MKRIATTILFSLLSVTVYADGNYGCVMSVSGGFHWENGNWKLTNFAKENILISVKENGSKLNFKRASMNYEYPFTCVTVGYPSENASLLSCRGTGLIEFDEINLRGGYANIFGSIQKNKDSRDSLSVTEFTCQKF